MSRPEKTVEGDWDQFLMLLDELKACVVVVEGKKDVRALARLGVNAFALDGRPLHVVVEMLPAGAKEVVLLVDYDREGREIFLKLKKLLQLYKIKHNARLRRKLMEFGKTRIEDFNGVASSLDCSMVSSRMAWGRLGLASPVKKIKRGEEYGKTCSYFNKVPDKGAPESERCGGKKRCYRCSIRPD